MSGSGISWATCKSASSSRQVTTPTPYRSLFTGRIPFLPPSQQHQSTEGTVKFKSHDLNNEYFLNCCLCGVGAGGVFPHKVAAGDDDWQYSWSRDVGHRWHSAPAGPAHPLEVQQRCNLLYIFHRLFSTILLNLANQFSVVWFDLVVMLLVLLCRNNFCCRRLQSALKGWLACIPEFTWSISSEKSASIYPLISFIWYDK